MAHFEIHVSDTAHAQAFYAGVFGWSFTPMPGLEAAEYNMIAGPEFGNGLTAAMMKRGDAKPASGSPVRGGTMTFTVADCDAAYTWALANGGAEALPPMDYPGVGRVAYVEDGEGNIVGMIKPLGDA